MTEILVLSIFGVSTLSTFYLLLAFRGSNLRGSASTVAGVGANRLVPDSEAAKENGTPLGIMLELVAHPWLRPNSHGLVQVAPPPRHYKDGDVPCIDP